MANSATKLLDAGSLDEIKLKGRAVVSNGPVPIVSSTRRATTRRGQPLPAHGFPLHRGTVEDGILTCHWHTPIRSQQRCTFDLFATTQRSIQSKSGTSRIYRCFRNPSRPSRARTAPTRRGYGPEHQAGGRQSRRRAHTRRGESERHSAGKWLVRSAPAACGLGRWHDDPLGDGQRERPPRRRRAHRAVVPRGLTRGVEHQRAAAANPVAASREQVSARLLRRGSAT